MKKLPGVKNNVAPDEVYPRGEYKAPKE